MRDGIWTLNGLTAEFRLLYIHPNLPDVYRVETVSGEHYAYEQELTWDSEEKTKEVEKEAEIAEAERVLDLVETELAQTRVNERWLLACLDEIHEALCPEQSGTWQQRAEQAVKAAKCVLRRGRLISAN